MKQLLDDKKIVKWTLIPAINILILTQMSLPHHNVMSSEITLMR